MSRELGSALREARHARGIELSEVHRDLKIRLPYLRAMEEDRWDELPGRAYARGFLATYAHYLGLDHHVLVERYEAGPGSTGEIERIPPDMLPQPGEIHRRRRLRVPRVPLAALALLVLAAVMAWGVLRDSDPSSGNGEGAGEQRSAPQDATATSAAPEPEPEPAPAPEPEPADEEETGGEADRATVRLTATDSVWVCLETDDGEPLIDGEVLVAGEKRGPFKPKPGHALAIGLGNGSIEITIDGRRVEVSDTPDPIGYRIRDGIAKELRAPDRPECV